ncbi:hypothetical protein [Nonomuraea indica]|uniref:Regulatory protein n=1 Tax=Nonomuraea indica TaxID=1581193 RepID=A0ABW8A761_9ACTN
MTLLELTAPAEEAVAQAFAHTAVLAGLPGNVEPLAEAGRFFGRIAHLLDAVEDQAEDAERGAFNPLTVTGTSREEARRLCDDAAHGLALAVRELRLAERHLVEVLLVTEVRRAVERTFGAVACRPPAGAAPASGTGVATGSYRRPGWIRRSAAGAGTVLTCGLWRPRWSRKRGGSCASRCYVCNQDCWESCDCCANCSCCACSCCE